MYTTYTIVYAQILDRCENRKYVMSRIVLSFNNSLYNAIGM